MVVSESVSVLKGVGEKTAAAFKRLGVLDVDGLIHLYPRYYLIYRDPVSSDQAAPGEWTTLCLRISSQVNARYVRGKSIVSCTGKDSGGSVRLAWFHMPYMRNRLHQGETYFFAGTPVRKNGHLEMTHPEIYTQAEYEEMQKSFQPIYPLTAGISNQLIRKSLMQAEAAIKDYPETLPPHVMERFHPMASREALWNIHFPQSKELLAAARKRLAFEEFFHFFFNMRKLKEQVELVPNHFPIPMCPEAEDLIGHLPYDLTGAQKRALLDMEHDCAGKGTMNRLIQGDVGSGKTILCVIMLLCCAKAGFQGALMAPTEVLAAQHYETFEKLLKPYGVTVVLLTGSQKASEKKLIQERIREHQADIVIGTHALIQDRVSYDQLGLVMTDEQHRFGVRQRETLAEKGTFPHMAVMSATPIPRSLAIFMYGDLDVSIIDEVPKNRLPIKNCVVGTDYRDTAYRFMKEQAGQGHQVYVICPMVEESETMEGENVIQYAARLKDYFPKEITVEYLHGKMKADQKQKIMERFAEGTIDVLVSTTVVEVGVDVPNATVMMIENSERFGLAQLHQLRGRVGRGKDQSYCIFMTSAYEKADSLSRLMVLNRSNDGFYIANEDLKLRGPGDFFGVRQSGSMSFDVADIYDDSDMMKDAYEAAAMVELSSMDQ